MTDQEKPIELNPAVPAATDPMSGSVPPIQPPPQSDVLPSSTVVMPVNGNGIPRWFYFVFGMTVIVFIIVTALLVLQAGQKQKKADLAVPAVIPSVIPTVAVSPILPPAATGAGLLNNTLAGSDEIASIEADLKELDFVALDKSLEEADREFNAN